MSVAARMISGGAASWARILITMISQVALVPIYLNYWTVETYGVWLAVQAFTGLMTMLDLGHQTYLGYEFLRVRQDRNAVSHSLWSGVAIGLCSGLFQIVLIFIFVYSGLLPHLIGKAELMDSNLAEGAATALIVQGFMWLIASNVGGFFVRALEPFGYLPRLAWWGVMLAVAVAAGPAIAVALGASLPMAAIVLAVTTIVFNIPLYLDMIRLMRRENIKLTKPTWQLGYRNFLRSTGVAGKLLLENARQQGVRLVLAPISGAVGLAAFSTMRTGSNVALQGLSTITNPLMPDLMRFLHEGDQERSEAAFGTVWIVVIALIAPAVIVLQLFIEPLFFAWTQGHIKFDPTLFALLSLTVLIYAVAQPAMAVVTGNNLMRPQLILSILAGIVVIGGIIALVPSMGILGAGFALVAAELVASFGYILAAKKWLRERSLRWPTRSFWTAAMSVIIAAVAMGGTVIFPQAKWGICGGAMLLCFWNFVRYWRLLPGFVTHRVSDYVKNLPGIRKLFPA